MTILSQTFMVLAINSTSSTINVAREDFRTRSGCPASLVNITIDFSIFQYTPLDTNLTLFYGNCSTLCNLTTFKVFPSCPMSPSETLPICLLTRKAMLKSNISVASCPNHLFLPTHLSDNLIMDKVGDYIPQAAWNGTELKWSANNGLCEACLRSGGQCGHEPHSHKFFCFCTDECKCPFPARVYLRSFGGVSYKSDVYSYGMLVLEMVGCRRKAENEIDEHSSEQYFPQWIYEQLEAGEAVDEQQMLSSDEMEIQKKLILVSLWCVKTNPSSRPEMSKVVEMLEGTVDSLQVPRISSLAPSSSTLSGSLRFSLILFFIFGSSVTLSVVDGGFNVSNCRICFVPSSAASMLMSWRSVSSLVSLAHSHPLAGAGLRVVGAAPRAPHVLHPTPRHHYKHPLVPQTDLVDLLFPCFNFQELMLNFIACFACTLDPDPGPKEEASFGAGPPELLFVGCESNPAATDFPADSPEELVG
uniref:Wall-associated receptor kinase C-terminal domain-containing protein n=1 Tax=Chenopodium quinoa TaxID=63459 RepID=A0A803M4A6_CHEQI